MDICFKKDESKFNFRVGALIIKNGRVLIHRLKTDDFYALPGGRVSLMEDTETALIREMKEELNIVVSIKSLLWVTENFFELYCEKYHEVGYYYLLDCDDANLNMNRDNFETNENGRVFEFKWVPLEELKNIEFYPLFIKNRICNLPTSIEKIVEIDNKLCKNLYRR